MCMADWLSDFPPSSPQAADLQSRYIELLTRSVDYHKYLGELLKNMEELKVWNIRENNVAV